jgi:hypothetical protein
MWNHWWLDQFVPEPVFALFPTGSAVVQTLVTSATVVYETPIRFQTDVDSADLYTSDVDLTESFITEVQTLRGI